MLELSSESVRTPLPAWTLVTSHGLVLLYVTESPDATIRQIAEELELTERRIADIVRDLEHAKLVEVTRIGRRNRYKLARDARFRHPFVSNIPFHAFVSLWRRKRPNTNSGFNSRTRQTR